MPVTIDEILKKPLSFRTLEDKLRIVTEDKPRPLLKIAAVKSEMNGEPLPISQFNPSMYDDVPWLTGCEKRNAFFCWPCLLFRPPLEIWNSSGVSDLTYLKESMPEHEISMEHITATSKFQKFVQQNGNEKIKVGVNQHNKLVKRNREILKRLSDIVCNLLIKEQSFDERRNGCQLNPKDCEKNLLFVRTYDTLNSNYIEDAMDLIKISPDIVNDLVDSVAKLIKLTVKREIQSSTYVSIILSDHSTVTYRSQISTVLRYIKDGKVSEKFIGFFNMCYQKSAAEVYQHISNIISEFGISEKLLAITLDGGILPTNDLTEFQNIMMKMNPQPIFVPWYCHTLEHILLRSLQSIKECRKFLKAICEMKFYFHEKSRQFQYFESFMLSNFPSFKNTDWFVRSRFTSIVHLYRKYFILFFESMLQNSTVWEASDLVKALGFQQILEEFQTVFLLQVFARVFDMLNPIMYSLKESPTKIFLLARDILDRLSNELSKFDQAWSQAVNEKAPVPKKLKSDSDPEITAYTKLYKSIIECIIQEIRIRYMELGKLKFCQLLCCDKDGNFTFTNELLFSLMAVYGAHFDQEQTKNELITLRNNGKIFAKKTVSDLLDFFIIMKLKNDFKHLYKLCEFILTLPVKPLSDDNNYSKFEKINDWRYTTEVLGMQTGDVGIPCVEIDTLRMLKKSNFFYNDVAEMFYDANKTFELFPK